MEEEVRRLNLERVAALGGRINPGLPLIGDTPLRSLEDVVRRSLVLHALLQLALDAPVQAIRGWIDAEGLESALSLNEQRLLAKEDGELTRQEEIDLSWSTETLYAFLWIGGLVEGLTPEGGLPKGLGDISPDIEFGEDSSRFRNQMRLRPYEELFAMRDLFYVAHWSARDARLAGKKDGRLDEGVVEERRKALEWVLDREMDWDDLDLST